MGDLSVCPGCRRTVPKLFFYHDAYRCAQCVLATERDFGGLGFTAHGRNPSSAVQEVYAYFDSRKQEGAP